MSAIMDILSCFITEASRSNPHSLVLKGGTALSHHHLKGHRDSEDLDFDAPEIERENIDRIITWIMEILKKIKSEGKITEFDIIKSTFAKTNRYHIKISISTHREHHTKIDIDFGEIRGPLEYEGELGFYTKERMLVSKLLAYRSRKTLKDIYDIHFLLKVVDQDLYDNRSALFDLVEDVIEILGDEELEKNYRQAFMNADMRFKYLKERDLTNFKDRTLRSLNIFKNQLKK